MTREVGGGTARTGRRKHGFAAMVSVITSCHHPAAALSLTGPQRLSQMVLLSLIKSSG